MTETRRRDKRSARIRKVVRAIEDELIALSDQDFSHEVRFRVAMNQGGIRDVQVVMQTQGKSLLQ